MKTIPLKNLFFSNISLKIISLMLGYTFWHITSIDQVITTTLTVPLCFTASDKYVITAPETITIGLKGTRSHLYHIDTTTLAAHVDISHLFSGKHGILITERHLFLPNTISVEYYKPSNLTVTLTET